MKYTIGEFAELLGVTVDTLRLYEKYGIIKPVKSKSNNYRYFNDFDARNMLMSRWYRSMGFPIQEVAGLIKNDSFEQIAELMYQKQLELEEEIKQKTLVVEKMSEIIKSIHDIPNIESKCRLKELPGIYRIRQTKKNEFVKDGISGEIVEDWMRSLPHTFFSFRINYKKLYAEEKSFDYNWGLALFEEDIKKIKIKIDQGVEYIEPNQYVSSVIVSDSDYLTRADLQFMFDYIQANNYVINGDIFGRIILTEKSKDTRYTALEVNIPIE